MREDMIARGGYEEGVHMRMGLRKLLYLCDVG